MSLIGKKIEEFNAQAYHQGEFLEISEKDLMGNLSILCFYPADFTFVCPTELEDLQEQYSTLKSLGVEVFSCSTDTHFTHKAWHDTSDAIGKIEYTMIGDPSHRISRIFDVLDEEQGLAQRGTFIIDPDGIVQAMEINADGVCPAKWKESGETLKPSFDLVGKI